MVWVLTKVIFYANITSGSVVFVWLPNLVRIFNHRQVIMSWRFLVWQLTLTFRKLMQIEHQWWIWWKSDLVLRSNQTNLHDDNSSRRRLLHSTAEWVSECIMYCCCCRCHCLYGGQRCPEEMRNSTTLWIWRDPFLTRGSWQPFYWLGAPLEGGCHCPQLIYCQTMGWWQTLLKDNVDGCWHTVKLQLILHILLVSKLVKNGKKKGKAVYSC